MTSPNSAASRGRMLAAALVAAAVLTGKALAGDPAFSHAQAVEFDSAEFTDEPSPFTLRQAQNLGVAPEVKIEPAMPVSGYLATPAGVQSRPAVILLHTCAGISAHEASWSKRLVSWGYVVLSVDSFTRRGIDYVCDSRAGQAELATPWLRALDAWGAKKYLSRLPYVDADRIALLGLSHGAMTGLEAIRRSTSEGLGMKPFRAAVLLYPLCGPPAPIDTPTLIMTGGSDLWTPAELCAQYAQRMEPRPEVELRVFAGAYHLFDHPGIDAVDSGYIIRSDPKAAAEAAEVARGFFATWLQR